MSTKHWNPPVIEIAMISALICENMLDQVQDAYNEGLMDAYHKCATIAEGFYNNYKHVPDGEWDEFLSREDCPYKANDWEEFILMYVGDYLSRIGQNNTEDKESEHEYIQSVETRDTGGNIINDVITLKSGMIVRLGEHGVTLAKNEDDDDNGVYIGDIAWR